MTRHRSIPVLALSLLLLLAGHLSAAVDRWTALGPDGGAVTALATAPGKEGLVFAGTDAAGVFLSRDGGTSWQPARSGLPSGQRIRFVTSGGPNGKLLFAALGAEVYASEDGGSSWKRLPLPRQIYGSVGMDTYTGIISFAVSPDARTLFIGYMSPGSDSRLFRSLDGGLSWSRIALGVFFSRLGEIAIAPSAPATVYAASLYSQGKILRSEDNGSTWSVAGNLEEAAFYQGVQLAVDPRDAKIVYAAYAGRVARSTDGGATWTRLAAVDPAVEGEILSAADLTIDPASPTTIHFAFNRYVPGYSGWYDGGIAKVEGRIFRTLDGGMSWSRTAVSDPVSALRIDGLQPSRVYAGVSRIGILRSESRGARWSKSNRGLMAASLCAVTPDPFNRDLLYISAGVCRPTYEALSDNNDLGFLKGDPSRSWANLSSTLRNPIRSLEAYALVADPQVAGTLYAATGHGLFRSLDGGGRWDALESLEPILEAVLSLEIDPTDPRILYAAGYKLGYPICGGFCPLEPVYGLARSLDGGVSWKKLQPASLSGLAVAIDPRDPRILYTPDGQGNLLKSLDRGETWTDLRWRGLGLEYPTVLRLIVDPTAPQTLYAVATSLTSDYLRVPAKSTDGGRTWSRVEQGLPPGTEVRDLALDRERPATLYAATNRGVFVSDNAAGRWMALTRKGLTNTDVYRVQVDPFDPAMIYAATKGDGGLFVLTRSDR